MANLTPEEVRNLIAGKGGGGPDPFGRGSVEETQGNIFSDLSKAVIQDVGKTLRSIPHLADAVYWVGRDDPNATDEIKGLRRRAIATTATVLASYGLGTLAAAVSGGTAIPLLAPLLRFATSAPGVALAAGAENVAFGRLDAGPGEKTDDVGAFIGGAGLGLAFRGLGKATGLARRATGKAAEAAVKETVPPIASGGLPPDVAMPGWARVVDAARRAAGETVSEVKPAPTRGRASVMGQVFMEIRQNHKELDDQVARRAWAGEVLGREIKTYSDITKDDAEILLDALRKKRGEGAIKATPTIMRVGKGISVGFPDAGHAKLYGLVDTATPDEAMITSLSAQLGIAPEDVLESAHIYRNIVDLAAQVNRGRVPLVKIGTLPEAIEMMPSLIQAGQQQVVRSGIKGVRSAGTVVTRRESAQEYAETERMFREMLRTGTPDEKRSARSALRILKLGRTMMDEPKVGTGAPVVGQSYVLGAKGVEGQQGVVTQLFKDKKGRVSMVEVQLADGKKRKVMVGNLRGVRKGQVQAVQAREQGPGEMLSDAPASVAPSDIKRVQVGMRSMLVEGENAQGLVVSYRGKKATIPWDRLDRRLNEDVAAGKVVKIYRKGAQPEVRGTPRSKGPKQKSMSLVEKQAHMKKLSDRGMAEARTAVMKLGVFKDRAQLWAIKGAQDALRDVLRTHDIATFQRAVLRVAFKGREALMDVNPKKLTPDLQREHARRNQLAIALGRVMRKAMGKVEQIGPDEPVTRNPVASAADVLDELFGQEKVKKPVIRMDSKVAREKMLQRPVDRSKAEKEANRMLAKEGFFRRTEEPVEDMTSPPPPPEGVPPAVPPGKGPKQPSQKELAARTVQVGDKKAILPEIKGSPRVITFTPRQKPKVAESQMVGGPKQTTPGEPVKPLTAQQQNRYNWLMENANHPDPTRSEGAKRALAREFGAEFPGEIGTTKESKLPKALQEPSGTKAGVEELWLRIEEAKKEGNTMREAMLRAALAKLEGKK